MPDLITAQGLVLPPLPQSRPHAHGDRQSLMMGLGAVLEPDGSVAWQEDDWSYNALHDSGEQDLLQVFLSEQAHKTKYLGLLNQATATVVAATDTFTLNSHGFVDTDQIRLGPVISGAAGITVGTLYYVINSAANTFKVSLTSGGSAVDVTSDGTVAVIGDKRGTMTATGIVEMTTPASNGYNRQQIANTDWTNDGLQAGDYRFSAAEKIFGPITGAAQTATHVSMSSTSATAGIIFCSLALSGSTVIAIGQSFEYILRWTQT